MGQQNTFFFASVNWIQYFNNMLSFVFTYIVTYIQIVFIKWDYYLQQRRKDKRSRTTTKDCNRTVICGFKTQQSLWSHLPWSIFQISWTHNAASSSWVLSAYVIQLRCCYFRFKWTWHQINCPYGRDRKNSILEDLETCRVLRRGWLRVSIRDFRWHHSLVQEKWKLDCTHPAQSQPPLQLFSPIRERCCTSCCVVDPKQLHDGGGEGDHRRWSWSKILAIM